METTTKKDCASLFQCNAKKPDIEQINNMAVHRVMGSLAMMMMIMNDDDDDDNFIDDDQQKEMGLYNAYQKRKLVFVIDCKAILASFSFALVIVISLDLYLVVGIVGRNNADGKNLMLVVRNATLTAKFCLSM